ncbi:hypothetical protein GCM10009780_22260 [Actinomadura alba]
MPPRAILYNAMPEEGMAPYRVMSKPGSCLARPGVQRGHAPVEDWVARYREGGTPYRATNAWRSVSTVPNPQRSAIAAMGRVQERQTGATCDGAASRAVCAD